MVEAGAARFSVEAARERAGAGELFALEPGAVHTGMAAVPEGWTYKVLYLDPGLLGELTDGDRRVPCASRWVVFRDGALRGRLLAALAEGAAGIALEIPVVEAVAGLRPHLRPFPEGAGAIVASMRRSAAPPRCCGSAGTRRSAWRS